MKKIFVYILGFFLVSGFIFGQADMFRPAHATTLGQGGAFTANPEGFNSFFYNPAGFARKGELTLLSLNFYASLDERLLDMVLTMSDETDRSAGIPGRQSEEFGDFDLAAYGISEEVLETLMGVADFIGGLEGAEQEAAFESAIGTLDTAGFNIAELQAALESGDETLIQGAFVEVALALSANPEVLADVIDDMVVVLGKSPEGYDSDEFKAALTEGQKNFPGGNIRAGGTVGLGYVGNGLGLGFFINAEANFTGGNILAARGRVFNTISFAAGLGFPIGPVDVGIQVRPTFVGYSDVNPSKFIASMLGGDGDFDPMDLIGDLYTGFRVGVDVGALWDLGSLTLGVAVKDLIPFSLQNPTVYTIEGYLDSLAGLSLPLGEGDPVDLELLKLPAKVNLGASWNPDLGVLSYLVNPTVSVDIHDLFGLLRQEESFFVRDRSIMDHLNVGAEVQLLRFASIRAGYSGSNFRTFTGGIGLKLLFLDTNIAIALSELTDDGSFRNFGLSGEFAIRF